MATALAAAAGRAVAASDQVSIGVIGVGDRGRSLLESFAGVPGCRIQYVCDADQGSLGQAQKVVQKLGLAQPKVATDMRRVFDDKEIDAVVIATPDHWHAPAAILACSAGKDVYVEKPPSYNIREGRLLLDAARLGKRIVQVGSQSRSRPGVIRAIEYVRAGKIGEALMAKAWDVQLRDSIGHKEDGPAPDGLDYDAWVGPAPWIPFNENRSHYRWHWNWHFGTGDAGNDGYHQIDIARWALGVECPRFAGGWGRKVCFEDDQQTPDSMSVTFDYGKKALLWEMRIWNPYGMEELENGVAVYGTGGMVHIGRYNGQWGFKAFDTKGKLVHHDNQGGVEFHARQFLDCVRGRELPSADIAIGHVSAIHSHLANIVARTGRNVKFDAEAETVVGDAHASRYVSREYRAHWGTPGRV